MENKILKTSKRTHTTIIIDDTHLVHIIKCGHEDLYFIIHDDAHEMFTGKTEIVKADKILERYNIDIEEY